MNDSGVGVNYVFGSKDGRLVKYGFTTNLEARKADLITDRWAGVDWYPQPLLAVRGSNEDERAVQRFFREDLATVDNASQFGIRRNSKEVFLTTLGGGQRGIEQYLKWLSAQTIVTRGTTTPPTVVVESSRWLPTEQRRYDRAVSLMDDVWTAIISPPDPEPTDSKWWAHPDLVEAIHTAFDVVDLDPCTSLDANAQINATDIYTIVDNGLIRPWYGKMWVNPPFSTCSLWAERIQMEWTAGRIDELLFHCTSRGLNNKSLQWIRENADATIICNGRLPHWDGHHFGLTSPHYGNVITYFGPNVRRVYQAFKNIGGRTSTIYPKALSLS